MNKFYLKNSILMGASGLVLMTAVHAGIPILTFAPVAGYPPSVTVNTTETANIKYTITNQSRKPHTLQMRSIQGITSSGCTSPLGYQQSCILSLKVSGSALTGDITGGPVLCEAPSLQCYQPSPANNLTIRLTQHPAVQQYTVALSAGTNGAVSPGTSQVVNSGATITFTATPNMGYRVNQWLLDGNLAQTGGTTYQLANITANHTVDVTFDSVTLTPSVPSLALSINCQPSSSCTTTQNAALTGNSRQITIQNTGLDSVTNVSVSSSGLPLGTSISSNTCSGTLNAGGSCVITLTPGAVASSDSSNGACTSGTEPVAGTITLTAEGGYSSQVNIYVLGYGCQYQGGFLYSVDDTTPNTGSIGGKVVSLVDQAAPQINSSPQQATSIIWSSNGRDGNVWQNVSYDTLPGIDETSTPSSSSPNFSAFQSFFSSTYTNTNPFTSSSFSACQGNSDGQCNTGNILTFYNEFITNYNYLNSLPFTASNGPTPLTNYAAGFCSDTISGYSGWYLPAICELDAVVNEAICPIGMQSMLSSLSFLLGDPDATTPSTSCTPPSGTNCLAGDYWSSTENSGNPQLVYNEYFASASSPDGSSSSSAEGKHAVLGVRCSRALTF